MTPATNLEHGGVFTEEAYAVGEGERVGVGSTAGAQPVADVSRAGRAERRVAGQVGGGRRRQDVGELDERRRRGRRVVRKSRAGRRRRYRRGGGRGADGGREQADP